jgi:RNA polymerase sigma factor (sigma-70 family)
MLTLRRRRASEADGLLIRDSLPYLCKSVTVSCLRMRWTVDTHADSNGTARDSNGARLPRTVNAESPAHSHVRLKRQIRHGGKAGSHKRGRHRKLRPLTEAQRLLAVRHLPLARSLTRRLESLWPSERDDIRSTAYEALVEAARTFDPKRGVPFRLFARHRIRGNLRTFQRLLYSAGWRGNKGNRPVLQVLGEFHENNVQVIGITPEPPVGQQIEQLEAFEAWLEKLPRAHAAACRLIYLHDKTQYEAAKTVRRSQATFSRLHSEAINMLIELHTRSRTDKPRP